MTEKKRILIIFGTRPEAIKMAPVVYSFKEDTHNFETRVCVTAQHREMLDQVLKIFDIQPDYDLNIMKKGQDLYDISAKVLLQIKEVFSQFRPDLVLVHGDTTTSTIAALAAFYMQVSIGHVEAGLRTNNKYSPWPEEMNRQITGRLANYHFSPTQKSRENLLKENVDEKSIVITGNTVIDALYLALDKIRNNELLKISITEQLNTLLFNRIDLDKSKIILVTGHRRENFGQGFLDICESLKEIALKYSNIEIIYPVHMNPNINEPVHKLLDGIFNIHLIDPLEYLPFIYLMSKSFIILTDSGGIQEEAPSLGKPVLVMREVTERPEAVEAGTVELVGTDKNLIIERVSKLITDNSHYDKMSKAHNPYGDGYASKRIVDFILNSYSF